MVSLFTSVALARVESCHSEQYMPKYPIYDQAYRPIQQQKTARYTESIQSNAGIFENVSLIFVLVAKCNVHQFYTVLHCFTISEH